MVNFVLKIAGELENLSALQPQGGCDDPNFTYYVKCKFCAREATVTMITGQGRPLTQAESESESLVPLMVFDCRNVEPAEFSAESARWKILAKVPKYSPHDQNRIICAAFALHNYIRISKVPDPGFTVIDRDLDFIPPEVRVVDADDCLATEVHRISGHTLSKVCDDITASLMANRGPRSRRRVLWSLDLQI